MPVQQGDRRVIARIVGSGSDPWRAVDELPEKRFWRYGAGELDIGSETGGQLTSNVPFTPGSGAQLRPGPF